MAYNAVMPNIPARPHKRTRRRISFIIVLGLSLGLMFMGADFVPLTLRPLDQLGIPYPHAFRFVHFIAPASVILVWLISRRSGWAAGVALFLAIGVMTSVAHWADTQPARIPITKWMVETELTAAQQQLGFKITETGDKDGIFLLVARGNEPAATAEVKRLGVYRR